MKAKEFLNQLETIKEENPAIFDQLEIEFSIDDGDINGVDCVYLDSITIYKLCNKISTNFKTY